MKSRNPWRKPVGHPAVVCDTCHDICNPNHKHCPNCGTKTRETVIFNQFTTKEQHAAA